MATVFVLQDNLFEELEKKLFHLIENRADVFLPGNKGFDEFDRKQKMSICINNPGNGIYRFMTNKNFSKRNITSVRNWIKKIGKDWIANNPVVKDLPEILDKIEKDIVSNKSRRVEKIQSIITEFENTEWLLFERFYDSLGQRLVEFGKLSKQGMIEIKINTLSLSYSVLEGAGHLDADSDYLLINVLNKRDKTANTNLMFRVNHSGKPTLLVGQMMYPNADVKNIVTKNVILKYIRDKDEKSEAKLETKKLFPWTDDFKILKDEGILKFFKNHSKNRLSTPKERIISSAEVLLDWQNGVYEENFRNIRYSEIIGDYSIYYNMHPFDNDSRCEDKMRIFADDSGLPKVQYIHKENIRESTWLGKAVINDSTKALSCFLHGPYEKEKGMNVVRNDKPMFLILTIPSYIAKDDNAFTGTITGIRDRDSGPVCRLIIAAKNDKIQDKKDLGKMIDAFYKNFCLRSWIRPPKSITVLDFKDLNSEEIIREGEVTRKKYENFIDSSSKK